MYEELKWWLWRRRLHKKTQNRRGKLIALPVFNANAPWLYIQGQPCSSDSAPCHYLRSLSPCLYPSHPSEIAESSVVSFACGLQCGREKRKITQGIYLVTLLRRLGHSLPNFVDNVHKAPSCKGSLWNVVFVTGSTNEFDEHGMSGIRGVLYRRSSHWLSLRLKPWTTLSILKCLPLGVLLGDVGNYSCLWKLLKMKKCDIYHIHIFIFIISPIFLCPSWTQFLKVSTFSWT